MLLYANVCDQSSTQRPHPLEDRSTFPQLSARGRSENFKKECICLLVEAN